MEKTEKQDIEDTQAQCEEHVVDDAGQKKLPISVAGAAEESPGGSSSKEPTTDMPDGLYIEGFEKDLARCLEKTAALRALADVEPMETPRLQKPRHPNPKCYCPAPNSPTLGDVEEQESADNERSSAPPSPAHDDDQSALEAQSGSIQVGQEFVPVRTHSFILPNIKVKRQPLVGLTVQKVDTTKVTLVVDDPVKLPPDAKLSFIKLFSFADTVDYSLMFLGSLGACAHGVAVPIFFVFFGRLINAFGFNQHNPRRLAQEVGKVILKCAQELLHLKLATAHNEI